jgi:hypothetical protein
MRNPDSGRISPPGLNFSLSFAIDGIAEPGSYGDIVRVARCSLSRGPRRFYATHSLRRRRLQKPVDACEGDLSRAADFNGIKPSGFEVAPDAYGGSIEDFPRFGGAAKTAFNGVFRERTGRHSIATSRTMMDISDVRWNCETLSETHRGIYPELTPGLIKGREYRGADLWRDRLGRGSPSREDVWPRFGHCQMPSTAYVPDTRYRHHGTICPL